MTEDPKPIPVYLGPLWVAILMAVAFSGLLVQAAIAKILGDGPGVPVKPTVRIESPSTVDDRLKRIEAILERIEARIVGRAN